MHRFRTTKTHEKQLNVKDTLTLMSSYARKEMGLTFSSLILFFLSPQTMENKFPMLFERNTSSVCSQSVRNVFFSNRIFA